MKTIQLFALAGISVLAMSNSCATKDDISPNEPLIVGRIVRTETTVDAKSTNPRIRWVIDIAPLSLPGWAGHSYQQAKVFNLPDTISYKTGSMLTFHYRLIEEAQQTPWRTFYEWYNVAAQTQPPGAVPLPEIAIADVLLNSGK
ncbi:hypothetical protein [Hymenobacter amundsenii]|uniref:hypothetical protein n=1 Tax=Hymenobacter amundsenii TaxID=2006685 RepID=UPI000F81AD3F|nr:hypothetical protein [Hymenobacter amundsenii]